MGNIRSDHWDCLLHHAGWGIPIRATRSHHGLPSSETLDLLQGYNLLRTDHNGWIELSTDGENMWVGVERK